MVYCKHNSNCLSTALCIAIQLFSSFVHKRMSRMKEVQMHRCKQFILGGLHFKLHKLGKDFIAGKSQYREIWLSVIRRCNKKKKKKISICCPNFLSVALCEGEKLWINYYSKQMTKFHLSLKHILRHWDTKWDHK